MTCRPSFAGASLTATPAVTPGQQLRLPKRVRSRYVLRVEILKDSGWTTSYTRSVKT